MHHYGNWRCGYECLRAKHRRFHDMTPELFKQRVTREVESLASVRGVPTKVVTKLLVGAGWTNIEALWIAQGRPYYNVHPQMYKKLIKIDLTKVPADITELPHPFSVVCINFPPHSQRPGFESPEYGTQYPPRALVTNYSMYGKIDRFGMALEIPQLWEAHLQNPLGIPHAAQIACRIAPMNLLHVPDISLEEAIQRGIQTAENYTSKSVTPQSAKAIRDIWRLIVTIGFLVNSRAEIVEYDVINADKEAYEATDDEQKKAYYERRARDAGKVGWNIGNDLMFLSDPPDPRSRHSISTGRQLSWSHIRAGHPHAVRYGPEKKKVKIMWFRPTQVRGDLPFKAET
jgi:hypothetical protein